jgi:hypothetical protein
MLHLPCLFRAMTGLYCPGCGGTRAVQYLLQGRLLLSLRYHPLVLYALLAVAVEAISFVLAKVWGDRRLYVGHEKFLVYGAVWIAAVNFAVKNFLLIVWGIDLLSDTL